MSLKEKIKTLSQAYLPEVIAIRRHLHQYPELSFQEAETGKFIAAKLSEYRIPYTTGWGGNGVVALIGDPSIRRKTIALRADIDALPILEKNQVPYKSCRGGVMHACGHDVHTASLLGAAKLLMALGDDLAVAVKLIFQPGEEKLPGGASLLIGEGVLENPAPSAIFGQHVHPPLQVGKVGFRAGTYMASADELYVTVKGKGGHGAMPQDCVDPVLMASHLVVALQQLVSRMADPTLPSVLTFGKINTTGGATNIIPNEVQLEGTFRTMDEKWRADAHLKMKKMAQTLAEGMGGTCDFQIMKGYPCLENEPILTLRAKQLAIEYLGEDNVVDLPIRMTSEDFAFYSHHVPACFYRLGTGNPGKGITSPVHTDTFDVDEACLATGMGLMCWLALQTFGQQQMKIP